MESMGGSVGGCGHAIRDEEDGEGSGPQTGSALQGSVGGGGGKAVGAGAGQEKVGGLKIEN